MSSCSCSTSLLKNPLFTQNPSSFITSSSSSSLFPLQKTPLLSLPSKPLLSFSLSLSLKKKQAHQILTPLVAQTSGWAQQEEEQQAEEGLETTTTTDGLSEWEAEGESEGEVAGVVAEGEDAFVEGESGDDVGVGEEAEVEEGGYVKLPEEAKLFVGNLSYDIDSQRLAELFEGAGIVEVAEV